MTKRKRSRAVVHAAVPKHAFQGHTERPLVPLPLSPIPALPCSPSPCETATLPELGSHHTRLGPSPRPPAISSLHLLPRQPFKLSSNQHPSLHRRGPSAGSGAFAGWKHRPDVGHATSSSQSSNAFVRGAAPHTLDMIGMADEGDDDEDDDGRYGKHKRNTTLEGEDDYEDIFGHYAMPSVPPIPHKTLPYSQQAQIRDDLQRNASTSNQSATTSSSRWGKWLPSRGGANDSLSEIKGKHTATPSISRRTIPLSSPAAKRFGWMPQTWATRLFLLVTLAEAAADISIEAVLLSRFKERQGTITDGHGNLSALPVFVMVFGMAHVYQCFLAVDSVVNRNTILVFGLVVFNSAFLIYALIQITEIRSVLGDGVIPGSSQVVPVQILTGAIPIIIGFSSLVFTILAWFLWKDFGWQIYKVIGADRSLKRAHMHFQIFVCLLKFDFFTFIAYCIQLVLVVLKRDTAERWVTIFAAPVALVLLIFAWYSVRCEIKWGMAVFMTGLAGGAGYFVYKMFRIWTERTGIYQEVYKSLTVFTVLALCLLFATFVMTVRCLMNFDMGLKGAMARTAEERRLAKEGKLGPEAMDISSPIHNQHGPSSFFDQHRGPSKGMMPLQSASSLHLDRHNARLSLD